MIRYAYRQDIGKRDEQQDRLLVVKDDFFAVFDGMGGHKDGAKAATLAAETMRQNIDLGPMQAAAAATEALLNADEHARRMSYHGRMGTTLVGVSFKRNAVIWCGDSRAYRLRNGELEVLTIDHGYGHMLLRHIGALGECSQPELLGLGPHKGDRYLLCSDGLAPWDEQEIHQTLSVGSPAQAALSLVEGVLSRDSKRQDNVTVMVVDYE